MSHNNSIAEVTVQTNLASIEAPGYDADISSIGLRSMDTVSTSQGGYSADSEDKWPTKRANQKEHTRQMSSQTIFASEDEEDENWSLILAHIDGQQANHSDQLSQCTLPLKHEDEDASDILHSQRADEQAHPIQRDDSDMYYPSPPDLSDWGSPLSVSTSKDANQAVNSHIDAGPENDCLKSCEVEHQRSQEETQVYSIHDPLEDGEEFDDGFGNNDDADDDIELQAHDREVQTKHEENQQSDNCTQTQVYDMYDPLSQDEDEFPDIMVPATIDSMVISNSGIKVSEPHLFNRRQHSTLSMTWNLEEMNFADSVAPGSEPGVKLQHVIKATESKRNTKDAYVLYRGTQSLINSPQPSQSVVEDISYVETSDTEEMTNGLESITEPRHSVDHSNMLLSIIPVTNVVPSSQAIIQSTIPNSMDECTDEITGSNWNSNEDSRKVLHETSQSSQRSSSPSSQRGKLSFDRVIKSRVEVRKRSSAKLEDTLSTTAPTSSVSDTTNRLPMPKRRPVLGLAKRPTNNSKVRAVKSIAANLSSNPPAKVTRRLYGVNHRRKTER